MSPNQRFQRTRLASLGAPLNRGVELSRSAVAVAGQTSAPTYPSETADRKPAEVSIGRAPSSRFTASAPCSYASILAIRLCDLSGASPFKLVMARS